MDYREETPKTIKECYLNLTVSNLKDMAQLLGLRHLPTRKDDLANVILSYLEGAELKKLWNRLTKLQQAAAAEAAYDIAGNFERRPFAAKYGNLPEKGLLELLLPYGRIPEDLRQRIKAFVPEPAKLELACASELPSHIIQTEEVCDSKSQGRQERKKEVELIRCDTERIAAEELRAVLRLIDAGKVSVGDKTRMTSAPGCRAITAVLINGDFYPEPSKTSTNTAKQGSVTVNEDGCEIFATVEADETPGPIRAFAWPMLAQAAGWAQMRGSRLELTKAGRAALVAPAHEALRAAWLKWLDSKLLDELRRIECIRGQTGAGKRGLTAPAERRDAILVALQECSPGKWIALDDFSRYMQASGFEFEVTDNEWNLYICEKEYGSLGYDGYGGWNILQFRYMLCLLFEYAATLGLLDVAYISPVRARSDFYGNWGAEDLAFLSRYDGLWYFRINNLGAYCLDLVDTYVVPPMEKRQALKLLSNFEIVADGGKLTPSDRLLLNKYGVQTSDDVWRLEQGKIITAMETGGSVEELRLFLIAVGGEMPETTARLLADLERRSNLLHDAGTAWLVECADPVTAALIANDGSAGRCCRLVGENTFVVPAASVEAFVKAVRKMGYPLIGPTALPLVGRRRD